MRVHLINPSDVSFGVAVITPRWLYVLAAATGTRWGDPAHRRRNARARRSGIDCRGRRRRHRHPHRQRAARLRNRTPGARARRLGRLRRHSRDALPGRSRASTAARMRSSRATAIWCGSSVVDDCFAGTPAAGLRGRTHRRRAVRARRGGICCRRAATCGRRCRPCAAARSTARSARSGGPTARSRGSATSIAVVHEIVELRRLGFRFIALADDNFYPVTLRRSRAGAAPDRSDAAARTGGAARRSASS